MTTSADPTKQITYADAGVDVDEGARAVGAIKAAVAGYSPRGRWLAGPGWLWLLLGGGHSKRHGEPVLVSG